MIQKGIVNNKVSGLIKRYSFTEILYRTVFKHNRISKKLDKLSLMIGNINSNEIRKENNFKVIFFKIITYLF